jgi:hypothetical protein
MQKHRTSGITQSQRKRTRPKVGQIGLPTSLRRSPDGPASRIAPRLAGQADLTPSHEYISVRFGISPAGLALVLWEGLAFCSRYCLL